MEGFSADQLESALAKLPSQRHRLAFAAGISERLLPNYEVFSREVGWGNPSLLRSAMDVVWLMVAGGKLRLREIRELQAQIRDLTPDTENFASRLTSAALDAASAVHETLEVACRDDAHRVVSIATFASDTVDLFLKERDDMDPNNPLLEQRILADPLMSRELKKQHQELQLLSRANLDPEFVRRYRDEARHDGKSNLDLQ